MPLCSAVSALIPIPTATNMKELIEYQEAVAGLCAAVLRVAGQQAEAMQKVIQAGAGLKDFNDAVIDKSNGVEPTKFANH